MAGTDVTYHHLRTFGWSAFKCSTLHTCIRQSTHRPWRHFPCFPSLPPPSQSYHEPKIPYPRNKSSHHCKYISDPVQTYTPRCTHKIMLEERRRIEYNSQCRLRSARWSARFECDVTCCTLITPNLFPLYCFRTPSKFTHRHTILTTPQFELCCFSKRQ